MAYIPANVPLNVGIGDFLSDALENFAFSFDRNGIQARDARGDLVQLMDLIRGEPVTSDSGFGADVVEVRPEVVFLSELCLNLPRAACASRASSGPLCGDVTK